MIDRANEQMALETFTHLANVPEHYDRYDLAQALKHRHPAVKVLAA